MESELPEVDSCNIRATIPSSAFTNACIKNLQFRRSGIQCIDFDDISFYALNILLTFILYVVSCVLNTKI